MFPAFVGVDASEHGLWGEDDEILTMPPCDLGVEKSFDTFGYLSRTCLMVGLGKTLRNA